MNRLILFTLLTCISLYTNANHFNGGQLRYEFTGTPLVYKVELILYNTCESASISFPTFTNVYIESKTQSVLINKNLKRVSLDTIDNFCTGTTTSCNNASSQFIGMTAAVYSDTVKLPVSAQDWNFVFSNSTRSLNILNLQSASSQSFYLDAPININNQNNSCAKIPDYPPMIIPVNDSAVIPLSYKDADGDSVVFSFTTPKSGSNMNIPYYSGYSTNMPFGSTGSCYIDNNNRMVLKSTTSGKYTIALRINEYRNGGYVGYSDRDFVVYCLPVTGYTVPYPKHQNNIETYTCPSRPNKLLFDFIDPISTDSVYIDITPPPFQGWTFSTTENNGIGSAGGEITWTTPASVNPATLTHFFIEVNVKDNGCHISGTGTYIYKVNIRDCGADSVWPGDANSDMIVNLYDPLAVALAYGDTGVLRPNADTAWRAQYCNFWLGSFLNNIDKKHADCNGDGKVDTADLNVISINYGKIHAKGGTPSHKPTAPVELYFDHSNVKRKPGDTAILQILLGNASAPVQGLYGLATNIQIDGLNLADAPIIKYPSSWLGNSNNTLSFVKDLSATSIDWAYARTDKQNKNGQGIIAEIEFVIPPNTQPGTLVKLNFDKTKLIDNNGLDITEFSSREDTFYIWQSTGITNVNQKNIIHIFPNPSSGVLNITAYAPANDILTITISSITGKEIINTRELISKGNNTITTQPYCPAGIYLISITPHNSGDTQTYKWVKTK